MPRLRLTIELEIEAEATEFQTAALAVPAVIGEGADATSPFSALENPVNAGRVLIIGIQNDLVDKMPEAKEVRLTSQKVETIGH